MADVSAVQAGTAAFGEGADVRSMATEPEGVCTPVCRGTVLPAYSEQEYWERRYSSGANEAERNSSQAALGEGKVSCSSGTEWYASWESLHAVLCDPAGPLGAAALQVHSRVLELGCGDSAVSAGLASKGFAVLAVDFSTMALQRAMHHPRLPVATGAKVAPGFASLVAADVRALPVASGLFDAVLDKGCFDALRTRDCASMLSEVCRALRPGGSFICISNSEALVRAHARKVVGWAQAAGTPFQLPGVDDEVIVHCYVRHGTRSCGSGAVDGRGTAEPPGRRTSTPHLAARSLFSSAASHSEVGAAVACMCRRIQTAHIDA